MNLLIYSGAAIVGFAGGVLVGYLIREATYWGEIADQYRAKRHGTPIR